VTQFGTKQTKHFPTLWHKRQKCLDCWMLLLWGWTDLSVELKIDINMNLQFTKVTKKSLQQNKVYLPLSHIELTREIKIYVLCFPLPLTAYELIRHSTQIRQHQHKISTSLYELSLNNIWRFMRTRTVSSKFYSTESQHTAEATWKESIYETKWIRARNKQTIHDPQLCFIQIGGFSFN
jgi:hypothetical protein